MFQKLNSHVWLVATVQGGVDGNVSVNARSPTGRHWVWSKSVVSQGSRSDQVFWGLAPRYLL